MSWSQSIFNLLQWRTSLGRSPRDSVTYGVGGITDTGVGYTGRRERAERRGNLGRVPGETTRSVGLVSGTLRTTGTSTRSEVAQIL